jgi:hypothetical protein
MKIELKSLKIYDRMSEETIAFTADVYVNGKKVAYAKNDGCGGSTYYNRYPNSDNALLNEAEAYCKSLPPEKSTLGDKTLELPQSLESVIDEWVYRVFNEKETAKFQKKLEKNMEKGLCFGTPDHYEIITWKGLTIPQMMAIGKGRDVLRAKILEMESKGKKVLNTNILLG